MDGEHDHERYEALAVGHVLGGLDEVAAADFRSHLLECRPCRQRVAELRELADDLEVAAREERAQLQLKTEVRSEEAEDAESGEGADAGLPWGISQTMAAAVAGVVLVVLGGLLFWNMSLSQRLNEVLLTTSVREDVLAELAEGAQVLTSFEGGMRGLVVVDSQDVTASLTDVPELNNSQALVVWTGDGDSLQREEIYGPADIVEGRLAFTFANDSADRMVVTIEPVPLNDTPGERRLAEARLRSTPGPDQQAPGGAGDEHGGATAGAPGAAPPAGQLETGVVRLLEAGAG